MEYKSRDLGAQTGSLSDNQMAGTTSISHTTLSSNSMRQRQGGELGIACRDWMPTADLNKSSGLD